MMRNAGMPMASIFSEALKIAKSLSGKSRNTRSPMNIIPTAYKMLSLTVWVMRWGFFAP